MSTKTTVERFEMVWDCPSCGASNLGASNRTCRGCGNAQDASRRRFPKEGEMIRLEGPAGPRDWECGFCKTPNAAAAPTCVGCGAPKGSGAPAPLQPSQPLGAARVPETAARQVAGIRVPPAPFPRPQADSPRPSRPHPHQADPFRPTPDFSEEVEFQGYHRPLAHYFMGAVVMLLVVGFFVAFFWTKVDTFVVEGVHWTRTIQVEELRSRNDRDWCDSMPYGAYDVSSSLQVRSTRQVYTGRENCTLVPGKTFPCKETCTLVDNGDGSGQKVCTETCPDPIPASRECTPITIDEPVYDQMCDYRVNIFSSVAPLETQGQDQSPVWPATSLPSDCQRVGCRRQGRRTESFEVFLRDSEGALHSCEYRYAIWVKMTPESHWTGTKRALTGSVNCSSLKPTNK